MCFTLFLENNRTDKEDLKRTSNTRATGLDGPMLGRLCSIVCTECMHPQLLVIYIFAFFCWGVNCNITHRTVVVLVPSHVDNSILCRMLCKLLCRVNLILWYVHFWHTICFQNNLLFWNVRMFYSAISTASNYSEVGLGGTVLNL